MVTALDVPVALTVAELGRLLARLVWRSLVGSVFTSPGRSGAIKDLAATVVTWAMEDVLPCDQFASGGRRGRGSSNEWGSGQPGGREPSDPGSPRPAP
jgi:hypothetical protein